ncbi:accessory Sec system protein Asp2 [Pediococcus claussenii]|uniref:Accessory Sec system protein Asp2 n=1 Tax=Pediococcus claussenii (strain ATCC BAA-344 / DSM 14800 / JCM 18046 / KCTC 3811 / LMG 21948 / P06) TaxID=701521 RepID=G8PCD1_PEDCP|nr:accessory Sec system protein Asp2 [Pediococcus claussenii]AEV94916.1 accessory Sec system protein Asp2 [Pediococcus claussenii ATCC BAA-344]
MARLSRILILGPQIDRLDSLLNGTFRVVGVTETDFAQIKIKQESLFDANKRLNSAYRNDLFFIRDEKYLTLANLNYLRELPANQIIFDQNTSIADDQLKQLFDLKNAQFVDSSDTDDLANELRRHFFSGQLGYKFEMDSIEISPEFAGVVEQVGHNYLQIEADASDDWVEVLNWRLPIPIAKLTDWDIWIENQVLNADTIVDFQIRLIGPETGRTYYQKSVGLAELSKRHTISVAEEGGFASIKLRLKGSNPSIKIGNVHLRQARNGRGEMMIGGNYISDKQNLDDQVLYYFDAADMKPPLNVYFSGFRPGEGYEGVFMMRSLQAPTLIFSDPRLLGGAFYLGSAHFEQKIVDVIKKTVQRLGFKPNEVILSGLSVGTFAAMYYSSKMQVDWVIVGKPLANVGVIASNERINRQDDFPTSLDLVLGMTGGVSPENMATANQRFWQSFKSQDYSHTGFVFSYMYNDDYDGKAFGQLSKYLHEHEPFARVRHKGLVGRHNDDTNGIVNWYLRQYRDILSNEYGREFGDVQ